jgi:hypothetical protein
MEVGRRELSQDGESLGQSKRRAAAELLPLPATESAKDGINCSAIR